MRVLPVLAIFFCVALGAFVGVFLASHAPETHTIGEIRTSVDRGKTGCFTLTETWDGQGWVRRAATPTDCPKRHHDDGPDMYLMPIGPDGSLMPMFF